MNEYSLAKVQINKKEISGQKFKYTDKNEKCIDRNLLILRLHIIIVSNK